MDQFNSEKRTVREETALPREDHSSLRLVRLGAAMSAASRTADEDEDLYRLLGFDSSSIDVVALTSREIDKSYRKQALKWHPDKNPGSKAAADMLARVFLAYETLGDVDSRKAYDDRILARRARDAEELEMNSERRRMRQELETRERESEAARVATRAKVIPKDVERKLQEEIERLRVDHGLGRDQPRDAAHSPRGNTNPSVDIQEVHGLASPWSEIDGFREWQGGEIPFEKLEEAVLARARGLIP